MRRLPRAFHPAGVSSPAKAEAFQIRVLTLTISNGETRAALINAFGYYRFDEVAAGETYILNAYSIRFSLSPQVVSVTEELTELNFMAQP